MRRLNIGFLSIFITPYSKKLIVMANTEQEDAVRFNTLLLILLFVANVLKGSVSETSKR